MKDRTCGDPKISIDNCIYARLAPHHTSERGFALTAPSHKLCSKNELGPPVCEGLITPPHVDNNKRVKVLSAMAVRHDHLSSHRVG